MAAGQGTLHVDPVNETDKKTKNRRENLESAPMNDKLILKNWKKKQ